MSFGSYRHIHPTKNQVLHKKPFTLSFVPRKIASNKSIHQSELKFALSFFFQESPISDTVELASLPKLRSTKGRNTALVPDVPGYLNHGENGGKNLGMEALNNQTPKKHLISRGYLLGIFPFKGCTGVDGGSKVEIWSPYFHDFLVKL